MPEADYRLTAVTCRGGRAGPLAAISLCIMLLNLGACEVKPTVRTIAADVRLDGEWTVIEPQPPLEVSERVQQISIGMDNAVDWGIRPEQAAFVMPDGSLINIEVELEAEDGRRFLLDTVSVGPGLSFSYLPEDVTPSQSRLPPEARFTTVRIRSDKALDAGPVEWICYTNF